jgi:hypothetical protein
MENKKLNKMNRMARIRIFIRKDKSSAFIPFILYILPILLKIPEILKGEL